MAIHPKPSHAAPATGPKVEAATGQLLFPFDDTYSQPPKESGRRVTHDASPLTLVHPTSDAKQLELRIARIFVDEAQALGAKISQVKMLFRPFRSTLYSYKFHPKGLAKVKMHSAFMHAPEIVLRQAARIMFLRGTAARKRSPRQELDGFIRALPASAFNLPGARPAQPKALPGPGAHRCLDESFDRVNQMYFGSKIVKPQLCWSPKRSRRILGTYNHVSDRLIISRIFDHPRVPLFVLDFLMYHELLHKYLGIGQRSDGRRCVHGPDFRRMEKRFYQYHEAEAFLKRM